jgi:cysteinyl-tRNA synthetase
MYTCGPTAYDTAHIGNFRAAFLPDLLSRALHHVGGYKVVSVLNVTDFGHLQGEEEDTEDKMTLGLRREGREPTLENMLWLGKKYGDLYFADLRKLGIDSFTITPYASAHIEEEIVHVKRLLDAGFAYETRDAVYFDVPKYAAYGALPGVSKELESRITTASEKRNLRDFALWKKNEGVGWESPWGRGFPGWHIECAAMATKYLGESFDIHAGGMDLAAVHHNNEIAEAEVLSKKQYVRFWLHNAFITINNEKISKSLGNIVTLKDVAQKEFDPLALRYWYLTAHYRTQMNFTWEALRGAETSLMKARAIVSPLPRGFLQQANEAYVKEFNEALLNDLNTAEALAVLWKLLKDKALKPSEKRKTAEEMDKVLGLNLTTPLPDVPEEIVELLRKRDELRQKGEYDEADVMRVAIEQKGYEVQDGEVGSIAIRQASRV